jgi:Protein of unknown function (DUF3616)
MRSVCVALATMGLLGCVGSGAYSQQASPVTLRQMAIEGAFAGKKAGAPATDISGMACLPAAATSRTCLLINDENKSAQFATIKDDRMIVGRSVPLIGKAPDSRTLGSPPNETCKEVDDFEEMDGEGVAYAEPYLYVVGSHGCSRNKGKFRLSSFILARVRVDGQGQPVNSAGRPLAPENFSEAVETTYRVSDWLKRSGAAAGFFAEDLESANGLNIEGVAVQGDTIWFGLRGPIVKSPDKPVGDKGSAFLVGGDIADLFKPGAAPSKAELRVIPVALEGLGIRDLALLPDQRLLVVAGAAHGPEVPFQLLVVDPANGDAKPIGPLAEVKQPVKDKMTTGKAEGVTVLDATADKAQIVILFDGLMDGAPHRSEISIPKRN